MQHGDLLIHEPVLGWAPDSLCRLQLIGFFLWCQKRLAFSSKEKMAGPGTTTGTDCDAALGEACLPGPPGMLHML